MGLFMSVFTTYLVTYRFDNEANIGNLKKHIRDWCGDARYSDEDANTMPSTILCTYEYKNVQFEDFLCDPKDPNSLYFITDLSHFMKKIADDAEISDPNCTIIVYKLHSEYVGKSLKGKVFRPNFDMGTIVGIIRGNIPVPNLKLYDIFV